MTTPPKEPKEWTIYGKYYEHPDGHEIREMLELGFESGPSLAHDEKVHVIEHSAYAQLQAKVDSLERENARLTALDYSKEDDRRKDLATSLQKDNARLREQLRVAKDHITTWSAKCSCEYKTCHGTRYQSYECPRCFTLTKLRELDTKGAE